MSREVRPGEDVDAPLEVVEILGFGRSGSTLLDRLLADALDAPGVGELVAVWRRGLLEDRHCSCGERFTGCPFWQAVVATDPGRLTRSNAADMVLQTNRIMRVWSPVRVWSGGARRALAAAVPASWFASMGALYRGVAATAGAATIVDSSKAPVLGYLLSLVPGLRVRPVPLVRDPRAVAWAWSHPGPAVPLAPPLPQLSPARAALVWTLVLQATEAVAAALDDGCGTVRYEDLSAAPQATVARILRELGHEAPAGATRTSGPSSAPTAGPSSALTSAMTLAPRGAAEHTMAANPRVRFATEPVAVAPDRRWVDGTSSATWAAVTALTLPGVLRHGYPLVPSSGGRPTSGRDAPTNGPRA